jgi:hypothetical protein
MVKPARTTAGWRLVLPVLACACRAPAEPWSAPVAPTVSLPAPAANAPDAAASASAHAPVWGDGIDEAEQARIAILAAAARACRAHVVRSRRPAK